MSDFTEPTAPYYRPYSVTYTVSEGRSKPDRAIDFTFHAVKQAEDEIAVTAIYTGGNASSPVMLKPGEEGVLYDDDRNPSSKFWGKVRWDDQYHVIRFDGWLLVLNCGKVTMKDCPIIALPR